MFLRAIKILIIYFSLINTQISAMTLGLLALQEDEVFRTQRVLEFENSAEILSWDVESISTLDLENPIFYYYRGLIHFNNGSHFKGVDDLLVAAEKNVLSARITIGDLYRNGWPMQNPDTDKALAHFTKAANTGSVEGNLRLAALLLELEGATQRVFDIYEKLALTNNPNALFNLGVLYETKKNNLEKAVCFYKKASEEGYLDATYNLFVILSSSTYLKHDSELGYKYLVEAAEKGHVEAQYHLGIGLIENSETNYLLEKGLTLLTLSAEKGYVFSQSYLGNYYAQTIDSEESYFIAEKWIKKAAENGDENSKHNLMQLYLAYSEVIPSAKANALKMQQN